MVFLVGLREKILGEKPLEKEDLGRRIVLSTVIDSQLRQRRGQYLVLDNEI